MKYDGKFASRWRTKSPDALCAVLPLVFQSKQFVQVVDPRFCPEDLIPKRLDIPFRQTVLIGVYHEICFDQNLEIHLVDLVIRMMMCHHIADTVNECRRKIQCHQHCPCNGWSFDFLIFSRGRTIFFFCRVNADVMHQCRSFYDLPLFGSQLFFFGNHFCKGIHLHKMLYPFGIPAIQCDHCHCQLTH